MKCPNSDKCLFVQLGYNIYKTDFVCVFFLTTFSKYNHISNAQKFELKI